MPVQEYSETVCREPGRQFQRSSLVLPDSEVLSQIPRSQAGALWGESPRHDSTWKVM